MNGTADAQMAPLRQEYDQLRQSTDLTQVTDTVWRLARGVGGFEARVEALRQGGYVFTESLANSARDLRDRWPNTEREFDRELREVRYDVERSIDRVDNAMRYAERAPDEGASTVRKPKCNPPRAAYQRPNVASRKSTSLTNVTSTR